MKRKTTAAVTGVTALVLAGTSAGFAAAIDHPPTPPNRAPAVSVHAPSTQAARVTTARVTATKPQQRPATAGPAAPHRVGTSTATVQQHHVTTPRQSTVQQHHATVPHRTTTTRRAQPSVHQTQPSPRSGTTRHSDHGAHVDGSGGHH